MNGRGERMIIGYKAIAASAALMLASGAGAAQAQGYYGQGDLPPPPYAYAGGGYGGGYGGGCGRDRFTLVGAHAGVTVLGADLSGSAGLSVPYEEACGGAPAPVFQPRPYAPAPMAYGYQGYEQTYAPPPPPPVAYGYPCGCQAPPRW